MIEILRRITDEIKTRCDVPLNVRLRTVTPLFGEPIDCAELDIKLCTPEAIRSCPCCLILSREDWGQFLGKRATETTIDILMKNQNMARLLAGYNAFEIRVAKNGMATISRYRRSQANASEQTSFDFHTEDPEVLIGIAVDWLTKVAKEIQCLPK